MTWSSETKAMSDLLDVDEILSRMVLRRLMLASQMAREISTIMCNWIFLNYFQMVNTSVLCCGVSTCGNWLWAENSEVTPSLGHEKKTCKTESWCQVYLLWSRAAKEPIKMWLVASWTKTTHWTYNYVPPSKVHWVSQPAYKRKDIVVSLANRTSAVSVHKGHCCSKETMSKNLFWTVSDLSWVSQ